ncbi:Actin-related protein 4 [Recurvomyces mirabilis]|uniref:Actin-related protein 4 n=1 Tax=Recurvomyces mirabilis TaxID=574656 RepID=A0AAE0WSK2_9PEZI|nr:Actin-related protein 4 [Recurvomyces mirabilis]KAK5159430.1 NuA4 histone acetyltransferase subunit [Recurvomyces mirabilis]
MAAVLPPTQAPSKDDYAGDEINALVLDPGSYTTRAGFAGEDTPKSVTPTHYALSKSGEHIFGENAIHLPRGDVEIKNPFSSDGLVEDWDTAAKLWEYAITSRLTGARQTPPSKNGLNDDPVKDGEGDTAMVEDMEKMEDEEQSRTLEEYPLLMSEPGWNPVKAREKTIELAMEEWGVPAFFLAKTGQLAAYGNGKATALVVDVGHQNTSVTAVWEGMVLRKSIMHSNIASSFLSDQIRHMFTTQQVPLIPHYMVKTKQPVDAKVPSNATYTNFDTPPHASFRRLEEERVLTSFKESVVQAWPGPGRLDSNTDAVKMNPARPFEMPDGWNTVFGPERFKVAEGLFDTKSAYPDPSTNSTPPKSDDSIPSLMHRALNACDQDTKAPLLGNIVLTGAGSLIEKMPERLQTDLQALYPNPRVRVIANSSSVERKYGAWIGGSVLGSLGTFHQMWISKEEYAEFGAGIVERRCK